jgi:hypothetical protein
MNVVQLLAALHREAQDRAYIRRVELLDQSRSLLKARLYLSPELFVQIYRNDRFDTTNFVLIHSGRRLYARDQLSGVWHRHLPDAPQLHDTSTQGRRSVDLSEFLDEVEDVLATLGLP